MKSKWCIMVTKTTPAKNKRTSLTMVTKREMTESMRKTSPLCQYSSTGAKAKAKEKIRFLIAKVMGLKALIREKMVNCQEEVKTSKTILKIYGP